MDRKNFVLITFENTMNALKGEKILENDNIRVIPIPSEISSGCGLSIMVSKDNYIEMVNKLKDNNCNYEKIYTVKKSGIKKIINEIYE